MVNRAANYTIYGFYYQFLHTIKICLDTFSERNDNIIICEGKEDIDVVTEGSEILIQVKSSKNKINISKESFKESIINFYIHYLSNNQGAYVFYSNASPCGEVINGTKTNTFDIWERCIKKNWDDPELVSSLISNLKTILTDYLNEKKSSIDLNNLNDSFLKKINIEFNSPDSSVYEPIIKEVLSKRYPNSSEEYKTLLFLNLLNFIIKKSISPDIADRKINYDSFMNIFSKSEEMLATAYKDVVICNEDKTEKLYLNQLSQEVIKIQETVSGIQEQTSCLTNNHLIPEMDMPEEKEQEYAEYPFVAKLVDASIPPETIFDAKNKFYQTEYALQLSKVFSSEQKIGDINRLKKVVKMLYGYEYANAEEDKLSSRKLLLNVYDKIIREHNNSLSCSSLRFDIFHKLGLMHHVSNEDEKVIWVVNNE